MPRNRVRLGRRRVRLTDPIPKPYGRNRVRLTRRTVKVWTPSWSDEIRGWTINYLKNHFWRVDESIIDYEDMLQEAYCVFLKIADYYPRVVEPAHFMSLYKTSLRNHITDLSRKASLRKDVMHPAELDDKVICAHYSCQNDAVIIHELISSCPELKLLIEFVSDEKNLELLREPQRKLKGQPRMTIDQRLANLLGTGPFPFKKRFKELLFG